MAHGARLGITVHDIDPKRPRASLLEKCHGASARPLYLDRGEATLKVGYVVSFGRGTEEEWFTLFRVAPWEVKA